uniref:Uncharacterized protein n=1 Tax=Tetranychus urticae TaxID=32264 RepID=T1KLY0_TETUR
MSVPSARGNMPNNNVPSTSASGNSITKCCQCNCCSVCCPVARHELRHLINAQQNTYIEARPVFARKPSRMDLKVEESVQKFGKFEQI